MPQNDFLQFCPTDTGTNLLSESDYLASTDRDSGNKPGVASSKLNNKALRQANFITSQLAQLTSDVTGTDMLDVDGNESVILSQLKALIIPLAPQVTLYSSGSGTHYLNYIFFIATGSATIGATYTNNTFTFTVKQTVASGLQLIASGTGAPSVSGTLTKSSGTGDATISFHAVRTPLYLKASLIGGGGGGGGQASDGGNGSDTTFGNLTGSGGGKGYSGFTIGGLGGVPTGGSGWTTAILATGGNGNSPINTNAAFSGFGGGGGNGYFGGGGGNQANTGATSASGAPNTGGGGAAGSTGLGAPGNSGGGAGGYVQAFTIGQPLTSYNYSVGAGGSAGGTGTGNAAGAGGSGVIIIEEYYQ